MNKQGIQNELQKINNQLETVLNELTKHKENGEPLDYRSASVIADETDRCVSLANQISKVIYKN